MPFYTSLSMIHGCIAGIDVFKRENTIEIMPQWIGNYKRTITSLITVFYNFIMYRLHYTEWLAALNYGNILSLIIF